MAETVRQALDEKLPNFIKFVKSFETNDGEERVNKIIQDWKGVGIEALNSIPTEAVIMFLHQFLQLGAPLMTKEYISMHDIEETIKDMLQKQIINTADEKAIRELGKWFVEEISDDDRTKFKRYYQFFCVVIASCE
jgi:hypothetical protein